MLHNILACLNPRRIPGVLAAIDRVELRDDAQIGKQHDRILATLGVLAACLFIAHYAKYQTSFLSVLAWCSTVTGHEAFHFRHQLWESGWLEGAGYVWWTGVLVTCYLLVPALVIRLWWRDRLAHYGLAWTGQRGHWVGYLVLISPILLFAVLASFRPDFQQHYPFYTQAGRSWLDLTAWWACYCLQFLCLEFFFRGFILRALSPTIGWRAIPVMAVPYVMIHFEKPWLEALGALPFGLALGVLALRSGSIWGGVLVHCTLAITMDALALTHANSWP